MTDEPNYELTITKTAEGWIVCEAGKEIRGPFSDEASAKEVAFAYHRMFQPQCLICGSAVTRPDDPWDAYSVSSKTIEWMHKSCMEADQMEEDRIRERERCNERGTS